MSKRSSSIFHKVPSGAMTENKGECSDVMRVDVGSGSRPVKSKIAIESSAPKDPYHLRGGGKMK